MDERIKMLISAYHDGELAGEEEAEIRAFIKQDEDAQAYLGSLQDVSTAISTVPSEPAPDGFSRQVLERLGISGSPKPAQKPLIATTSSSSSSVGSLDPEQATKRPAGKVIRLRDRNWFPAAIAAIMIFAVYLGTVVIDLGYENNRNREEQRIAMGPNPNDPRRPGTGSGVDLLNEMSIERTLPNRRDDEVSRERRGDFAAAPPPESAAGGRSGGIGAPDSEAGSVEVNDPGKQHADSEVAAPAGAPVAADASDGAWADEAVAEGGQPDAPRMLSTWTGTIQIVTISLPSSELGSGGFGKTLSLALVDQIVELRTDVTARDEVSKDAEESTASTAREAVSDGTRRTVPTPRPSSPGEARPSEVGKVNDPKSKTGDDKSVVDRPKSNGDKPANSTPAPADDAIRPQVERATPKAPSPSGSEPHAGSPQAESPGGALAAASVKVIARIPLADGPGENVILEIPTDKVADVLRRIHDLSGEAKGKFAPDAVLAEIVNQSRKSRSITERTNAEDAEREKAEKAIEAAPANAVSRIMIKLRPAQ